MCLETLHLYLGALGFNYKIWVRKIFYNSRFTLRLWSDTKKSETEIGKFYAEGTSILRCRERRYDRNPILAFRSFVRKLQKKKIWSRPLDFCQFPLAVDFPLVPLSSGKAFFCNSNLKLPAFILPLKLNHGFLESVKVSSESPGGLNAFCRFVYYMCYSAVLFPESRNLCFHWLQRWQ